MFGITGSSAVENDPPVTDNEVRFGPLDEQRVQDRRREQWEAQRNNRATSPCTSFTHEDDDVAGEDVEGEQAIDNSPVISDVLGLEKDVDVEALYRSEHTSKHNPGHGVAGHTNIVPYDRRKGVCLCSVRWWSPYNCQI